MDDSREALQKRHGSREALPFLGGVREPVF
jgi:hypothetical protein